MDQRAVRQSSQYEGMARMNRRIVFQPALFALLLGVAGCGGYVSVPPKVAGESLTDMLLPGGKLVGQADQTARQVGGGEDEASALYERLTVGAKVVTPAGFQGEVRQRPDGVKVSYLWATDDTLPTILVQVKTSAGGVVIRRLEFPPGLKKDGGPGA